MPQNRVSSLLIVTSLTLILMVNSLTFFSPFSPFIQTIYAQPSVSDTGLNIQAAIDGLSSPTSMVFLDNNNILVLEKEGSVRLVSDGVLREEPVLQVPVNTESERGVLGVAFDKHSNSVFLYYTEADPLRNRIYKYQWNGQSLVNPTLLLDLPGEPGPNHDGGKIVIGPDGYLYAVIGDLNHDGQLQNFPDGPPPDDTSVILRVNLEDGSAAPDNPFANSGDDALSKYYAYGIRNSFGMDFDPVTGNLWDTENGPASYDETNLVRPGFNSGWQTVMGPISLSGDTEEDLVNFPGSHYADPLFSWAEPPAVTDIEFLDSSNLGDRYANNIFVGDINNGNLYFFGVNENRNAIQLDAAQQESGLSDLVVDNEEELSAITFGSGFGGIT
ncbi:MAG TPA: PQQ-dependent sugar dehydrogenase, partial [Nitrososphaeraceae archaeon]|nr:PQQ-dependent sugar dehydrogenase [Nitrososphaeraceae archaeon]